MYVCVEAASLHKIAWAVYRHYQKVLDEHLTKRPFLVSIRSSKKALEWKSQYDLHYNNLKEAEALAHLDPPTSIFAYRFDPPSKVYISVQMFNFFNKTVFGSEITSNRIAASEFRFTKENHDAA